MTEPKRIERVGVVGGGNMGSGIAQKIATEGWPVVVVDTPSGITRAQSLVENSIKEGLHRRIYTEETATALRESMVFTTDYGDLDGCDLVIEAVFEDESVKAEVFENVALACGPDTILATNTSSFSVTNLAESLPNPEQLVGLHFFYHPAKNRLVEVVPGAQTSQEAFQRVWHFIEAVGKTPISCMDKPGFAVNRFFVPWLNEACRLLEEGLDIPSIEAGAKRGLGTAFGPFELMNMTGIPIALHAQTTLFRELGAFYEPSARLAAQVESGQLWAIEGPVNEANALSAEERTTAVVSFVSLQLVGSGVATMEDTDIGARVGLRWPLGPFERMNQIGLEQVSARIEALTRRYEKTGIEVPHLLTDQLKADNPFHLSQVNSETSPEGVTTITLNRPDALNALSPPLVAEFADVFDAAVNSEKTRAIVLKGAGKAFVAGADLKFFQQHLAADNVDAIVAFTKEGQDLFRRIDESPKRVVALLDGLSLGGGSELALCADVIVATDRGTLGFPETGLGIYPGLGGTQRAARRCGVAAAQWLILTGQVIGGRDALAFGLVDAVVSREECDSYTHAVALDPNPPEAKPDTANPRVEWAQAQFSADRLSAWLSGESPDNDDAVLAKVSKRIARKAPVACRIATELVALSTRMSVNEGVTEELRRLPEVFATRDAAEGIQAVLERRRPEFVGH